MRTPTYQEQFNKLTEAYINNKVNPYNGCACFVGNLLNRNNGWEKGRLLALSTGQGYIVDEGGLGCTLEVLNKESNNLYTPTEIFELEKTFLKVYRKEEGDMEAFDKKENGIAISSGKDEEALFKAFKVTLEQLKQIHISKGEVIDEVPVFKKRQPISQH